MSVLNEYPERLREPATVLIIAALKKAAMQCEPSTPL